MFFFLTGFFLRNLDYIPTKKPVLKHSAFSFSLADLLWPVLRGDQPVQALPDLHQHGRQDVPQQEEERSPAPPLRHLRRSLRPGEIISQKKIILEMLKKTYKMLKQL